MIRNVLGLLLLFLLPTFAYLGYALLTKPGRPVREVLDETPFVWLGIFGVVLAFATLIYYGVTSGHDGLDPTSAPAPEGKVQSVK